MSTKGRTNVVQSSCPLRRHVQIVTGEQILPRLVGLRRLIAALRALHSESERQMTRIARLLAAVLAMPAAGVAQSREGGGATRSVREVVASASSFMPRALVPCTVTRSRRAPRDRTR